jgi:hypothetical protein
MQLAFPFMHACTGDAIAEVLFSIQLFTTSASLAAGLVHTIPTITLGPPSPDRPGSSSGLKQTAATTPYKQLATSTDLGNTDSDGPFVNLPLSHCRHQQQLLEPSGQPSTPPQCFKQRWATVLGRIKPGNSSTNLSCTGATTRTADSAASSNGSCLAPQDQRPSRNCSTGGVPSASTAAASKCSSVVQRCPGSPFADAQRKAPTPAKASRTASSSSGTRSLPLPPTCTRHSWQGVSPGPQTSPQWSEDLGLLCSLTSSTDLASAGLITTTPSSSSFSANVHQQLQQLLLSPLTRARSNLRLVKPTQPRPQKLAQGRWEQRLQAPDKTQRQQAMTTLQNAPGDASGEGCAVHLFQPYSRYPG